MTELLRHHIMRVLRAEAGDVDANDLLAIAEDVEDRVQRHRQAHFRDSLNREISAVLREAPGRDAADYVSNMLIDRGWITRLEVPEVEVPF